MTMATWQRSKNRRGALRAIAYCAFVALVSLGITARSARAELGDRTLVLGREMLTLAKASHHDVTKIEVNGQEVFVGSSVTSDGVRAVLDRYEESCRTKKSHDELVEHGMLRSGTASEGTIVCFTKGARTMGSLSDAVEAFAMTGELGRIGNARLVYARRSPSSGNTTVLTAWTDEKFNLLELAPEDTSKDATGADFPEVPRPSGSVRVLSAVASGTPYGLNVYRSGDAPAAVIAAYDTSMTQLGWHAIPGNGDASRLYSKDGVVLTLAASREGGETLTGLGVAGVAAESK